MSRSRTSQGIISIFLLLVVLCGSIGGVLIGYGLDGMIPNRLLLAILTAFLVIVLVHFVRVVLGRRFPSFFLARQGTGLPLCIVISACVTALVTGLAGHDLSAFIGVLSGAMIGFISGTLSALLMGILVMLYFQEHPEERVEF